MTRLLLKTFLILTLLSVGCLLCAESDLEKAVEFRKQEDYTKAERILKKYSSPANFESLNSAEKIEFLRGLLELAHIRALKDDVSGSLALLNWAENRNDPFQRAIACVKYAEILLDLGEFERASAYLKNADEVISKQTLAEDTGVAIGQGGVTADTGVVWRDLRDESDMLKAEIEAETLKEKFGASYGNYVKLRRLQVLLKRSRTPRYLKEAMKLADELIETDPASQFAAAATYLKGEIMASRLTEDSPKKEIKEVKDYLDKFVRQQPDGLYRGEALMLLGKISLEIEWNAKDAEKYYSQALTWFQKAREKRDAVSLYAAMNDDLKSQSAPTQKPTTLNEWKRIVYHDEDPLKLYNTANAPVWYIDDKEKNCVYVLGFLAFADVKYDIAKSYWEKILSLSPDVAALDQRLPNVQSRLLKACRLQTMSLWTEDKSDIKDKNVRLRLQYAEYLMMIEQFDLCLDMLKKLYIESKDNTTKGILSLELGIVYENAITQHNKNISAKYFNWVLAKKEFKKKSFYGRALFQYGYSLLGISDGAIKAIPLFEEYVKQFPQGRDFIRVMYYLGFAYGQIGELKKAENILQKLKENKSDYAEILEEDIQNVKQNKREDKQ